MNSNKSVDQRKVGNDAKRLIARKSEDQPYEI